MSNIWNQVGQQATQEVISPAVAIMDQVIEMADPTACDNMLKAAEANLETQKELASSPDRWRWQDPLLKSQVKKITFNKTLQSWMNHSPDVYNWVWSSVCAAVQTREHTTEVPVPAHVSELMGLERIYVVKKDEGVIGVMI